MAFSDPQKNIEQFQLGVGMNVADLGAGSGAYTIAAARATGNTGRVYAIEVQRDLATALQSKAKEAGLHNVDIVWGDAEKIHGTKLADSSCDAAIVSNILFQVEDKETFAQEAARIVKINGKILVIDWQDSFGNLGPRPEEVVVAREARALFERAGFIYEREIEAGEYHYGMVMRKG